MLRLCPTNPNLLELRSSRYKILFSYGVPVAYVDGDTGKVYKTTKKHSHTTSTHIGSWFRSYDGEVEQEVLDHLL